MKYLILTITIACSMPACTKLALPEKVVLDGKYTGTFERTSPTEKETSTVHITFSGNTFEGAGDKATFPAICNGTYSAKGNDIHFENHCMWTAAFDWTLILSKDYSLKVSGDGVEIKREYPGLVRDIYKLKKESK